jgi:hypothetical protein
MKSKNGRVLNKDGELKSRQWLLLASWRKISRRSKKLFVNVNERQPRKLDKKQEREKLSVN